MSSEPPAAPVPDYTFPGLKDRDIYVFAIEAYGYATFSRERMAELVGPARERFADALRAEGYEFRSSFLLSPVAGGFSWLAEATFLTGQWIDSQNAFLQLYDADLPTLTGMLHDGGYYTFTLKPGTVHASWPEGWDLFRFEEAMVAFDGDFNYAGPWFSYVPITDQFTLWAAHNRITELTAPDGPAANAPLLAYYQLVSSHTPFNKIPPLIETWEDLGDGSVYHARENEIRTFNNSWGGGTEMDEGYSTAISYVFNSLGKYVEDKMDLSRDPLIIVFGDHQAQRPIREQEAHLSVPIHVASRDPEILALFEEEGYRPGLDGGQPPPHPRMSTFFPTFARIAMREPERVVRGEASTRAGTLNRPRPVRHSRWLRRWLCQWPPVAAPIAVPTAPPPAAPMAVSRPPLLFQHGSNRAPQLVGFTGRRVGTQLDRSVAAEDEKPVAEAQRFLNIVGDEEHPRGVVRLKSGEQRAEALPGGSINRGERFVQQENRRLNYKGARQRAALPHASGQLMGEKPGGVA